MPRRIAVDVTQEDIDKAMRSDSARCVVAQAIARTLPDARRISVDVQTVRFTDGHGVRRVYLTPVGVEQYVIGFDAGDKIEPFSFGLYDSQRVNVPTKQGTDAGRKRRAAEAKVRDRKAKAAALEADPDATEAERAVAAERVAAAEEHRERVTAETAGQPWEAPIAERQPPPQEGIVTNPRSRAPRLGAGSNNRNYGHRTMRINQKPREPVE